MNRLIKWCSKILLLYILSLMLGILVGLVGSSFRFALEFIDSALVGWFHTLEIHHLPSALISGFISMFLVLSAFLAVKYIAPEASGSGVQEIEGALLHQRPIFWRRLIPVKFVFGIASLAAKMLMGREGPTIHIGGNLGAMLGEFSRLNQRRSDSLIAAGAASGLAVAFNAPLAGIIFILEEMRNQFNYSFTSFTMVAISCISATVLLNLIMGTAPTIPMALFQLPPVDSLWVFSILGLFAGLGGLLFNRVLMKSLDFVEALTFKQQIQYVALVGFLVGNLAVYYPSAAGDGMQIIQQALSMSPGLSVLCFLFFIRFIGTMACYSTGVPGGIFAPALALGTLLGIALFSIFSWLGLDFSTQPGAFAVAGMAGFFAAVTRAPITGGVLVVEMTQNYNLIFPVIITCITATIILQLAGNPPIYQQLLHRTLKKAEAEI